ncbi:MAG: hypothetical protein HC903_18885 [Methylacidiphilales bacterium]|nr:hypothetical protein [Candidatus Methylacidiphilales bacterium]NJR18140.1 hypothetical protein [Calothrix sp. CSU_2_0]
MSSIKISNLSPLGSELFLDSESFLHELTELTNTETQSLKAGLVISQVTVTRGFLAVPENYQDNYENFRVLPVYLNVDTFGLDWGVSIKTYFLGIPLTHKNN